MRQKLLPGYLRRVHIKESSDRPPALKPTLLTTDYPVAFDAGQFANDKNQRIKSAPPRENNIDSWQTYTVKPKSKREEPHWIVWKTGQTPEPRSHNDSKFLSYRLKRPRAPTPPDDIHTGADVIEDGTHGQLLGECDDPVFANIPGVQADGYSTYVPGFRTWVSNANNYDKAVVYNMLKTLNGGRSTGPHQGTQRHTRSAGPRYEHPINFERKVIQKTFDTLGSIEASNGPHFNTCTTSVDIPISRHPTRAPSGKNYAHETSFFMNSMPLCKSHFIINPEWVSENKGTRKNLGHMKSGPHSLRYGSKPGF